MFEAAELGQSIPPEVYRKRLPELRVQLLDVQRELRKADFPVIVLLAGVDGAGKGEIANALNFWLDPRRVVTRAYGRPSDEESERPEYWRFWRDLPPRGAVGILLRAWYSRPLLQRVHEVTSQAELDVALDRIVALERTLVDDGAVILKFWLHLGKEQQRERFEALEADPLTSWRVTKRDWDHWRLYDRFVPVSERIIMRTSRGSAPWRIVEGYDFRYASLEVGGALHAAIRKGLEAAERRKSEAAAVRKDRPPKAGAGEGRKDGKEKAGEREHPGRVTILSTLDMSRTLAKEDYERELEVQQARLNLLHRRARASGVSTVLVMEGWDAAGKGGAIRRIIGAIDARSYRVISVAAPTDEESAHHYLWRFWRQIPRAGSVTIYDRSWYGRVLVERVEGFAAEEEWQRAYAEINEFEEQLVEHGIVLVKVWIHLSREEQKRRFADREKKAHKRWKLTEEDWRNRERWTDYETAVHDMVARTSTPIAPWILVEGNDKRYARIRILDVLCAALERSPGLKETPTPEEVP